MTGNEEEITIEKESTLYMFDYHSIIGDGELIGLEFLPGEVEYANLHIKSTNAILRSPSNYLTNSTTEKMRSKRVHVEAKCKSCIKEQKQKNIPKYKDFKAEEAGGKVLFI